MRVFPSNWHSVPASTYIVNAVYDCNDQQIVRRSFPVGLCFWAIGNALCGIDYLFFTGSRSANSLRSTPGSSRALFAATASLYAFSFYRLASTASIMALPLCKPDLAFDFLEFTAPTRWSSECMLVACNRGVWAACEVWYAVIRLHSAESIENNNALICETICAHHHVHPSVLLHGICDLMMAKPDFTFNENLCLLLLVVHAPSLPCCLG